MLFGSGFDNPEGPVSLSDGSWIVTEMNAGVITHVSSKGKKLRELINTGRPNGLAIDSENCLWIAESKHSSLLKLPLKGGSLNLVSTGPFDLPFLWPNDLCVGPDGFIYLTDSGILLGDFENITPPEAVFHQPIDGRLFRINPLNGNCSALDRGLWFANGIAFGPSKKSLYVNETLSGNIWRYEIKDGELVGERQLFGNVMKALPVDYGQVAGPDGMAFDLDGNLYVAVLGQGDITVLNPSGAVVNRIPLDGDFPTNIAFEANGEKCVLITEGSKNQLLKLDVPQSGLPLFNIVKNK